MAWIPCLGYFLMGGDGRWLYTAVSDGKARREEEERDGVEEERDGVEEEGLSR
jgi:hypothetical protein